MIFFLNFDRAMFKIIEEKYSSHNTIVGFITGNNNYDGEITSLKTLCKNSIHNNYSLFKESLKTLPVNLKDELEKETIYLWVCFDKEQRKCYDSFLMTYCKNKIPDQMYIRKNGLPYYISILHTEYNYDKIIFTSTNKKILIEIPIHYLENIS